ncbi:MAG: excinuclease ABC subunit UvrA, partial [Porticoccaceae bacterium]|nr:excinuclease ABC subunit UvrA [Porticoccaceae bacterium]
MDTIQVRGARTHNLKNIDLDLPRDKFIVITGLSGSGKSSLAFDTLYAEGQRRYVESLSTYARQFLSMMEKPDVDHIEGLSPAISIEQKSTSHNPRSTVGTITEIYDYLRLLFARAGEPRCPEHNNPLKAQTVSQMVDQVMAMPEGTKLMLLAPVIKERKGEHLHLFETLRRQGFIRARIDGIICDLDEAPVLAKNKKHTVEVVVDRFKVKEDIGLRLAESFETALNLAEGLVMISYMDGDHPDQLFSAKFACPICNYSINELEPRLFSFNNPAGACPTCDGLGVHQFFDIDRVIQHPEASIAEGAIRGWDRRTLFYYNMLTSLAEHYQFDIDTPWEQLSSIHQQKILFGSDDEEITFNYVNDRGTVFRRQHTFEGVIHNMERRYRETESQSVREELTKYMATSDCPECSGTRLRKSARNVFIDNRRIEDIVSLPVGDCADYFDQLTLGGRQGEIADKIVKEIRQRFTFLVDVGLNYLSLDRSADTLSGGEAQRIRLASQIGAGLVGVMYILDEPSIGLHQRDNERLLKTLVRLRDLGNTVIVVEHDEEAIAAADYVVDIGPGAGIHGGAIVAEGSVDDIHNNPNSITGQFLSGVRAIEIPRTRNQGNGKFLSITGASGNNLQMVDLNIPQGVFTCITGVSGSGKSTLINETLYPAAAAALNKATTLKSATHEKISGLNHLDKCIDINQSPIGRTPRSNPATYTGIFTPVREIFAGTQEARSRGYAPGRFSFNVKGG